MLWYGCSRFLPSNPPIFLKIGEARSFSMSGPQLMYVVYILKSQKDNKTYVGYTKDLEKRLKLHNSGQVEATKHRTPFYILFKEEFQILVNFEAKSVRVISEDSIKQANRD